MNSLQPVASQEYANRILIAPVLAWGLQMVLGAAATTAALPFLFTSSSSSARRKRFPTSSVPYAKLLLRLAALSNTAAICVVFWELADFSVRQDRSFKRLSTVRLCRAVAPIPIALTAAFTQAFMALRCWNLANRSMVLGVVLSLLIFVACASGIVFAGLNIARRPLNDLTALVFPQLFTWASLLVDTIITAVLVYNFHKRKHEDLPQRSRKLLNGLIRTAFETCAIPWFVVFASSVFGAVAFVHPAYTRPIYWALCAIAPALYLFSFICCLQSTMQKMNSSVRTRNTSKRHAPQCLCAYVKPFDDYSNGEVEKIEHLSNKEMDIEHGCISSTWEAPASWESNDWFDDAIGEEEQEEGEVAERAH